MIHLMYNSKESGNKGRRFLALSSSSLKICTLMHLLDHLAVLQILVCSPPAIRQLNMESIAAVNTLPCILNKDSMLIFQESYIDLLGALLVYARIDVSTINVAMWGKESSMLPILPSGFIISGDGRSNVVT